MALTLLKVQFCMVKWSDIFRRCSGVTNHNFRVKSMVQFLYHYRYMPANFQAGGSITGVGRKVTNLRFWPILYVKEPCMKWGRARSGVTFYHTKLLIEF